jgi:membrane protein
MRVRLGKWKLNRMGPSIPSNEWLRQTRDILVQTCKDLITDNAPQWAAAISYYSLLSLFPLLLAAVSGAAYFVDSHWAVQKATDLLDEFVPQGGDLVREIVFGVIEARGPAGFLSFVVLLWTGSRVFGVLIRALNIIYDVDQPPGFWNRLLLELGMTLSVGLLFVLSLTSGFTLDLLWRLLQVLPSGRDSTLGFIKWLVPALLIFTTFFLIYRLIPRGRQDRRAALVGAGTALVLFLLARHFFLSYVEQFAKYNLVYGSLAIVIAFLVWAWLVAFITLFGGELASHYQMIVLERQSPTEVGRRHEERSPNHPKREREHRQKETSQRAEPERTDRGLGEGASQSAIRKPKSEIPPTP